MGLQTCDESLSHWYRKAATPQKSLQNPIQNIEPEDLSKILARGRNRENANGTVSEDLGFQVGFWNGQEGAGHASLSIRCGLYWRSANPGVSLGNCVVLDLPKDLGALAAPSRMSKLLALTAEAWQPDWAGVMSESSMLNKNFDAEDPLVDWMIYVPHKVEGLSDPSSVVGLQGNGSLVIVQPDPSSTEKTESLSLISNVENAIKRARR